MYGSDVWHEIQEHWLTTAILPVCKVFGCGLIRKLAQYDCQFVF